MRLLRLCVLWLVLGVALRGARAQTASMPAMPGMPGMTMPDTPAATTPATAPANDPDVKVALSTGVEDGKKQLIATVTRNGKPVENATVSFGVKRTFGRLILGTDVTLDDGTAAIAFPIDIPGNETGALEINAMVQGPLSKWGAFTEATLPGGKPKAIPTDSFPRALWAPSAPFGLIAVIVVLVGGAWGAYLFVAYQLIAIRKGATL